MTAINLRVVKPHDCVSCSSAESLLKQLGGPSKIVVEGHDQSRTRVIVTLLHANEPSGLRAILRYLKQGHIPQTTTVFIIASVNAALTPPLFFHRMLPGQADLNRCFSHPPNTVQGALAKSIREQIAALSPELVVDMHNTSGDGPAFCVITQDLPQFRTLASHFAERVIVTDIQLGSLMEQDFGCPVVTFEAGGSENNNADNKAYEGLLSLLHCKALTEPVRDLEVLHHPRRLELQADVSLRYSEAANDDVTLTLRSDIERFNFGVTPPHTALGWLSGSVDQALTLDSLPHTLNQCFTVDDGKLVTTKAMRLFMITTRTDIARSDCLFYFQY